MDYVTPPAHTLRAAAVAGLSAVMALLGACASAPTVYRWNVKPAPAGAEVYYAKTPQQAIFPFNEEARAAIGRGYLRWCSYQVVYVKQTQRGSAVLRSFGTAKVLVHTRVDRGCDLQESQLPAACQPRSEPGSGRVTEMLGYDNHEALNMRVRSLISQGMQAGIETYSWSCPSHDWVDTRPPGRS